MIGRLDTRTVRQPVVVLLAGALLALVLALLQQSELLILAFPILVAVGLALVLARYPWTGFAILVMTVPFQRFGSEETVLPATLTQLFFPVALMGAVIALLAAGKRVRGHVTLIPYAALLLVMIASSVQAQSYGAAWAEIARWFVALIAFCMALQFVVGSSERRLVAFAALLAAGGVFEATIGVVQSVVGFGPFEVSSGVSRAYGTFGRPNSFAGYLEMTLFPAVAMTIWFASECVRRYRVYSSERLKGMIPSRAARWSLIRAVIAVLGFAGAAAIVFGGVVASLSRGALLGIAVGGVAMALLVGPRTRLAALIVGLGGVALIFSGLGGIVPENYRERLSESVNQVRPIDASTVPITDENFATIERLAHWQTGINMYQDRPILGVGIGNYNVRFEDYSIRDAFRESQGHAHNYYIHTLAETGLIGLLAYLSLLGSIVVLALRVLLARTAHGTLARMIVLGAFGSIMAVATHNLVEDLHVLNLGIVISLLWAMVIAGHERWRSHEFQHA